MLNKFIKSITRTILASGTAIVIFLLSGCNPASPGITAKEILGNPAYRAISFGGYRQPTREFVPTVEQLKEDMRILEAMGIKVIRTYNTQEFAETERLLRAIRELRDDDPAFEMYVMLGAWIQCEGAFTPSPRHEREDLPGNTAEIKAAIRFANQYPDIVKIIAVGNEAMVHWAASYYVYPDVILKWVRELKKLRKTGGIPRDVWITSSDNFASWGGGDSSYHLEALNELIEAVDYISMHTYPFHDTHYNPEFWRVPESEQDLDTVEKVDAAMRRARDYAISQYEAVRNYVAGLGVDKDIHIGETGWASIDNSLYGPEGSHAAGQYQQKLYYDLIREWSDAAGISCFYFEAFDEPWKDAANPDGSENHFGLINIQAEAKYVIWELVDAGAFEGLTRDGRLIRKTFGGNVARVMESVEAPPPAPASME